MKLPGGRCERCWLSDGGGVSDWSKGGCHWTGAPTTGESSLTPSPDGSVNPLEARFDSGKSKRNANSPGNQDMPGFLLCFQDVSRGFPRTALAGPRGGGGISPGRIRRDDSESPETTGVFHDLREL